MSYLFWAYACVWAGIVAYLLFLGVRLDRVDSHLARLEARVGRGAPTTSA